MKQFYFNSRKNAQSLLKNRVIGVLTEYTIYRLNLLCDGVEFRCLQDLYTFEVQFSDIKENLHLNDEDLGESFLDVLSNYCSFVSEGQSKRSYPVCDFYDMDALLDWFLAWQRCSERERLQYIEQL